ncbi:helix-turn-helix domain-containing protein [Paenibacillus sanguinis]|uniref:helix-turn-helix domain-containing protein n=1 Tax=Paenibacillus sanguinis TaxID=225906 RepID=UPI00036C6E85|nr:helix-turn-helix domain-containing protein [Paenibacillus sanguinis]
MGINDMRKQRKLYSKLLLTITACISLTLLLTTLMYYTYYTRVEKTEAFRSDLNNLSQTSQEVIRLTESAQSLSFQLYRNYTISKLLLYSNPDIYEVTAAMNELRNYLSSIPFIDSIYVYNPGSPHIYIATSTNSLVSQNGVVHESELVDKEILDLLNSTRRVKPFTPIPRSFSTDGHQTTSVYSFLCFDTVNWNEQTNSAIVVNISADWINRGVSSSGSNSSIYLIDDQDRLLSGVKLIENPLTPAEKQWLKENILDQDAGYLVQDFRGENALISYTAPDKLGWQYMRITPYREIAQQTSKIRNTTLIIAASILLAGAVISSYLSKRLYKPISHIMLEMNKLANERRDNMYTLKQNALRHLVLGDHPGKRLQSLQSLGINLNLKNGYHLILLRIDHYKELLEMQGSYIHPYKFAIMNIATEVCGASYRPEAVDMNDDSILLLLNLTAWSHSSPTNNDHDNLEDLLHQIRTACLEYLKISITSVYGALEHDADSINRQYLTVREAAPYRLFYGHGSVMNAAELSTAQHPVDDYTYPAEWEKKMVEALISGKAEEAVEHVANILNETAHFTYDVVQFAYSRVKLAVQSVIDNIRKRGVLPLEGLTKIPDLDEVETIPELQTAFLQLFEEICGQFAEKKNTKQHDLVRRINEKIQRDFADPNLNLNQIANELGMSAVYISRLYKQHTLFSIMDVVMDTRLNEVCRLLKETDLPIAAIAEQTGFTSSSYLHRTFKRNYNVTPNEYRHSTR